MSDARKRFEEALQLREDAALEDEMFDPLFFFEREVRASLTDNRGIVRFKNPEAENGLEALVFVYDDDLNEALKPRSPREWYRVFVAPLAVKEVSHPGKRVWVGDFREVRLPKPKKEKCSAGEAQA